MGREQCFLPRIKCYPETWLHLYLKGRFKADERTNWNSRIFQQQDGERKSQPASLNSPTPCLLQGIRLQLPLNKPVFLHSQGKPGFYKFCDHSCQTLQPLGKMAPSFSRSFYWALGCAGWAPGKTQPSTGYAPYNVLADDVLVHFLTFHIMAIEQQTKRSWLQKAVSFSTRYLLVEGPKKIWFAMELAPSDLP